MEESKKVWDKTALRLLFYDLDDENSSASPIVARMVQSILGAKDFASRKIAGIIQNDVIDRVYDESDYKDSGRLDMDAVRTAVQKEIRDGFLVYNMEARMNAPFESDPRDGFQYDGKLEAMDLARTPGTYEMDMKSVDSQARGKLVRKFDDGKPDEVVMDKVPVKVGVLLAESLNKLNFENFMHLREEAKFRQMRDKAYDLETRLDDLHKKKNAIENERNALRNEIDRIREDQKKGFSGFVRRVRKVLAPKRKNG